MKQTVFFVLISCQLLFAATYYVRTDGTDAQSQSGTTTLAAWKSLAYACERISTKGDTIKLGQGVFIETRPSVLPDGIAVLGIDTASTHVKGASTWTLEGSPRDIDNTRNSYLLVVSGRKDITIAGISFSSADTTHRLFGALWCKSSNGVTIRNCFFTEFFWNGVCLLQTGGIQLHDNLFYNACMQKDSWTGGQILVKWINNSEFYNNRIIRRGGQDAYGYKAQDGGHRKVKIHHNTFSGHYFSIESAHDNEYELEIYENELGGCVSVPKHMGGYTTLPAEYSFGVWIHHNVMHDSYTIEGPRNFLRISHNYIDIKKVGGRVYTQHQNSIAQGPVWIHNNVIVNLDRGLVWAHNAGKAANFQVYNNTIYCADAGDRTEAILGVPDSAKNWVFQNNIVIAPVSKPRVLYGSVAKGEKIVKATHNAFMNVGNIPAGNWTDTDPGLRLSGAMPYPYYALSGAASFSVNRGTDVGLPFEGSHPDLGAYEFSGSSTAAVLPQPQSAAAHSPRMFGICYDLLGRPNLRTGLLPAMRQRQVVIGGQEDNKRLFYLFR